MTQPRALYLADILEDAGKPADIAESAAAELRRLHAELERCKQVCAATAEAWRQDTTMAETTVPSDCTDSHQPVAWLHTDPDNHRVRFLEWREDQPG